MTRTSSPDRRTLRAGGGVVALLVVVAALVGAAPVGAVPTTTTFSYTGPAVPIPDAADLSGTLPGAPVTASVSSSGLLGPITDIDLRIDGSACSATAGSTTVGIDHTFVADLEVSLTSPAGTTVKLIDNTDGGGNNFCQTLLDDEASAPIQAVVTANAPFTGSFTPANPLSAFDGEVANGTWILTVQDFVSQDTGNIRAFSVIVSTDPTNALTATKTVTGTFAEGGTVTYSIVATNGGNAPSTDNPGHELTDILPPELSLVSATATSGTAVATIGTNTVTWDGGLAAGGSVTITVTATVDAGTENELVSNQAALAFDADVNGTNEATGQSDDPAVSGATNPTDFSVAAIPPSVTVEQATGQGDPTSTSPVHFTVTFSEPVTGFTGSDVVLSGTAGATTATVTGSGAIYDVAVSGMTTSGTVVAAVPAGRATDAAGNANVASTSRDASVAFQLPAQTTTTTTTSTTTTTTTTTTGPAALPATGSGPGGSAAVGIVAVVVGIGLVLLGQYHRPRAGRHFARR